MKLGLDQLIDPRLAAYVEEAREFDRRTGIKATMSAPGPSSVEEMVALRATLAERPVGHGPAPEEVVAEAGGRKVPVRVLMPPDGEPRGVFIDIHGGGFFMGWAARNDMRNRLLSDALGIAVVGVDYRLAPEHPYPAGPDDCEAAVLWVLENAAERFGTSKVAIGGASSGGNLAMVTLLRLRDKGLLGSFVGAVLIFGAFDLSGLLPGGRRLGQEFLVEAYAGHVADRTDPDVSPIFAYLTGLPPSLLVVGTEDILFEDSLAMAGRLSAAGNDVDLRVFPESAHGFTSLPIAMGRAAWGDIEGFLAERFGAER
jgi:acetyl esterase